jgi:hypothetical protein
MADLVITALVARNLLTGNTLNKAPQQLGSTGPIPAQHFTSGAGDLRLRFSKSSNVALRHFTTVVLGLAGPLNPSRSAF